MKSRRAKATDCHLFALAVQLARKMLVHYLQSVGYHIRFSRWSHHVSLSLPPTRATKKQRTILVAATSQSVRVARSLATRFEAGQPHSYTCVCPHKWVGGKRVCTLVAGTQDIALGLNSYYSYCKSCNRDNICTLILHTCIILSANVFESLWM
jgi:hypothetical protein